MKLLSQLVSQHPGETPRTPFDAFSDRALQVTAVLERTAVVHEGDITAKRLVSLASLSVEDGALEWFAGPLTSRYFAAERGRRSSSLTQTAKRQERRFAGMEVKPKTELQLLREQGKRYCSNPECRVVGPLAEFNGNGYCRPCGRVKNAKYDYAYKKARRGVVVHA